MCNLNVFTTTHCWFLLAHVERVLSNMDLWESTSIAIVLQWARDPALTMAIGRWLLTNHRLNQLGRKCVRVCVCMCVVYLCCSSQTYQNYSTGVPYTPTKWAICYCIFHFWLLVPGLSWHFWYCFLYNPLFRSALVSNILGNGYKLL